MEVSPKAIFRILFPRLPLILKTAILNALSLSDNAAKQNLTTEVTVVFIRSLTSVTRPVRFLQRFTTKDPGIKGRMWISKVTLPVPNDEDGPLDAIRSAIAELGDGSETYTVPELAAVEAEWTGYRDGVAHSQPRPDLPESDQYTRLMEEVSSEVTILYFHGGAYLLMDPSTVRDTTVRQAKMTRGRCYSVRYRLAPQHPFPAQLLDALISYLSLLSPPPGVPHAAVSAKHIVFAGDSAGANLATALLLLILTLRRMGKRTIKCHGVDVPLDLPAGLALNSPWVDIGRSMPSITKNAQFDYLHPPNPDGTSQHPPTPDDLWPSEPPRADIFCNASMMVHPLVSPMSASPELWNGMPPAFICLGNEALEDEILVLARRMHRGAGTLELIGYEGMPHCFAMLFSTSRAGQDCFERWCNFCSEVVQSPGKAILRSGWVKAFSNPLQFIETSIEDMSSIDDKEADEAMRAMQQNAVMRERDAFRKWSEQKAKAKL